MIACWRVCSAGLALVGTTYIFLGLFNLDFGSVGRRNAVRCFVAALLLLIPAVFIAVLVHFAEVIR